MKAFIICFQHCIILADFTFFKSCQLPAEETQQPFNQDHCRQVLMPMLNSGHGLPQYPRLSTVILRDKTLQRETSGKEDAEILSTPIPTERKRHCIYTEFLGAQFTALTTETIKFLLLGQERVLLLFYFAIKLSMPFPLQSSGLASWSGSAYKTQSPGASVVG